MAKSKDTFILDLDETGLVETLCALTCFGSTANGSRLNEHHKHNKWRKTEENSNIVML